MKGMTQIIKTVTRIMAGIIFVYGVYIITHGHLTPGGGFAGGAVIAGAFFLIIMAFGSGYFMMTRRKEGSAFSESLAIIAFLLIAVAGIFTGSKLFFTNFLDKGIVGQLFSAGTIPINNVFIGLEVAAALISIFLAFLIYKEEQK